MYVGIVFIAIQNKHFNIQQYSYHGFIILVLMRILNGKYR